jgi:hypothetical protein
MRRLSLPACLLIGCAPAFEAPEEEAPPPGTLSITSPAPAAWLPVGSTPVAGTADNITTVSANGATMARTGQQFSGTVDLKRGVNLVEVIATEADGDTLMIRHGVLAGDFASPDDAVTDAAVARLNHSGLGALADFGAGFVDPADITKTLADAGPVFSESLISGTWAEAVLSRVDFGTPQITLNPTPGALEITVALPDVDVDTDIYGEIVWIDFTQDLNITTELATITAALSIDTVDGRIVADVLDPTVALEGFAYDLSLLPSFIEGYVFIDTIRAAIEEELTTQMAETIPEVLDETLSTLDFSFSTELMDQTISAAAAFAHADIDRDGIEIGVDMDVSIPSSGTAVYNGYLAAEGDLPQPSTEDEVAILLSDDLLNRLAFEVWRGGLMDMTLSTTDGSLDAAMIAMLRTDVATVEISADLPPVIAQSDAGILQLQIAELGVTLLTPGGELGEEMVLDVAVFAEISPVLEDGELSASLGELDITIATRSSDWGASTEATTRLVEEMLPLELIPLMLSQISFPIPELGGLTIASADVDRASAYATEITLDVETAP